MGILGQKKKNESCIFQSVRASGDLIGSVLATLVENKVVPNPSFYGLQNEKQLYILLILGEKITLTHSGFFLQLSRVS